MRIEKNNIVIRSANIDDAVQLNKWWNDVKIMEHAGFPNGIGESLEDTKNNIRHWEDKLSQLCIIEIDDKSVGELSYRIKDDAAAYPGWKICDFNYQNHGYGTKIIIMLFKFIFTDEAINSKISIEKIIWDTMLENKRAQNVYENKIGAKQIDVQENAWKDQLGNWRSTINYEITREDFFSKHFPKELKIDRKYEEIQSFQEADYESFVDMFNSYFLDDLKNNIQYLKIQEICSYLVETVKNKVVFLDLMKIYNKPIGFIIYQTDSPESDWCQKEGFGFIREIYIKKEFRDQGLGKLLVSSTEKRLKDMDVEHIYLTSDNSGWFWNQRGYIITDEVGYRNGHPIYIKTLG